MSALHFTVSSFSEKSAGPDVDWDDEDVRAAWDGCEAAAPGSAVLWCFPLTTNFTVNGDIRYA